MRIETLPSPGNLSNGIKLRVEAAKAIGSIETTCMRTPGGKTSSAKTLSDFFSGCVTALADLYDVTSPTMAGATGVAASATKITLAFAETMDEGVVCLPADITVNNGGVVTAVAWGTAGDAGKLVITGTGFAASDTVTYTKPSVNALRDRAGNQVASGTKVVS